MRPSTHEQGGSVLEPREFEPALDIFRAKLKDSVEPETQYDLSVTVAELEKTVTISEREHLLGKSATETLLEGLSGSDWSVHQSMLLDYRWNLYGYSDRVNQISTRT